MKRRCFCGQSILYPVCDGQHNQLGWTCASPEQPDPDLLISASPHSFNLAEKAAHHFKAKTLLNIRSQQHSQTLLYFCDGSDYAHFRRFDENTSAVKRILINLGEHLPHPNKGNWDVYQMAQDEIHPIIEIEKILNGQSSSLRAGSQRKIFLTHAIQDEDLLEPVIHKLRQDLGWEIFLCADSIQAGGWFEQIEQELKNCDCQLFIVSKASIDSVFCAFETGLAMAWNKPIAMVGLDGHKPPAYLQHLQMFDCGRLANQKPWLNASEVLMDCTLSALGSVGSNG